MEVLRVDNLSYTFPGQEKPFLKKISFSLQEGEFVLLSGESGSGKSTLLNCLNGIIPHIWKGELEGEVWLKGANTASSSLDRLVQLAGTVWQDVESQLIQLKVEDELIFGMENIGLEAEEIDRRLDFILPLVGLSRTFLVRDLSGGQKQRLAIGAVLAMLPQVILLDEPLANLDLPGAHSFLKFLQGLCRQGRTVLMVEHRLDLSSSYVDRLIILEKGRIKKDLQEKKLVVQEEISIINKPGLTGEGGLQIKAGLTKEGDPKIKAALTKESGPQIRPALTGDNRYIEQPLNRPLKVQADKSPVAVEAEGLLISYGKKAILSNLNLQVKRGEKIVILGENGTGKSTFLKTLAGIRKGCSLQYKHFEILGQPVRKNKPAFFSSNIGLVMQNPNHQLFMDSVYREVGLNAPSHQTVMEVLELFGMAELSQRHPLSLSQGQKRLLAIAAIVANKPPILLLDEPTIGQDYFSLQKILEIISWLNEKEEMTVITATHDWKAAESLGDRAFIFSKGRISKEGGRDVVREYFNKYR